MIPDRVSFADVLAGGQSIADVAIEGIWPGLSLVPGNKNTDKATRALHGEHGREHRLREAVEEARGEYDLILIDCAPSLELHTVNALTAADFAIVIAEPGKFSMDGLGLLQDSFESIHRYYNPGLAVAGIVLNGVRNTVGHRTWIKELAADSPWPIIAPRIPFWTVIQDSQEAGYGLDEWPADTHRARQAYDMYALHYDFLRKTRVKKGR
jgi:chromosome partitioning protein